MVAVALAGQFINMLKTTEAVTLRDNFCQKVSGQNFLIKNHIEIYVTESLP